MHQSKGILVQGIYYNGDLAFSVSALRTKELKIKEECTSKVLPSMLIQ